MFIKLGLCAKAESRAEFSSEAAPRDLVRRSNMAAGYLFALGFSISSQYFGDFTFSCVAVNFVVDFAKAPCYVLN